MNWQELLSVRVTEHWGLSVEAGPVLLALVVLLSAVVAFWVWRHRHKWTAVEAEIALGGLGHVKVRPNYDDAQLAHRAWVELATRKASLPFDEDNDVIVEVYDSWYQLFRELRRLAKDVPAERIRQNQDTAELVRLLIDALNFGLRPHLTKWHARFRSWYQAEVARSPGAEPQELQRRYPAYRELVSDLRSVNGALVAYADFLRRLAHGR